MLWLAFGHDRVTKAKELADLALSTTKNGFPGFTLHNDKADAWRHCFWSALMEVDVNLQPYYSDLVFSEISPPETIGKYYRYPAYEIGYHHEVHGNKVGQPEIEYAMDMHNNNFWINYWPRTWQGCFGECRYHGMR